MSGSAIVVGAGVWGASTALALGNRGWQVTLIDQDEPGNARAASGGHSRVIRFAHGENAWYTRLAWQARGRWKEIEAEAAEELLVEAGVLWLCRGDSAWETASERVLRAEGIPVQRLEIADAATMFPSFADADLEWALYEPCAGALRARNATQALVELARRRGVRVERGRALPAGPGVLVDGEPRRADRVVWACGAWMPQLFAGLVRVKVSRRDYAELAAGPAWALGRVPAWIEFATPMYGVPGFDGHGFKVAPDDAGPDYEPEGGHRVVDPAVVARVQAYAARRFPALAGARAVGGRVCQYGLTPDDEWICAPHPEHEHVWLLAGDSGHGFKHGPALGEHVAALLEGAEAPRAEHGLGARVEGAPLRTSSEDFGASRPAS